MKGVEFVTLSDLILCYVFNLRFCVKLILQYNVISSVRRILKRGGYFERVRSVQTTLTRIFIDLECLGKLGNSKLFSAQNQVISKKKKKKKKVFAKIQSDFAAEIRNSKLFSAQNQVISKKKKKIFAKIQSDFAAVIRNSKLFSAQNQVVSKIKKKKGLYVRPVFHPNSLKFPTESLMTNLQRGGGHASILLTLLCNPSDPKGGPWHNGPPPKHAPERDSMCFQLILKYFSFVYSEAQKYGDFKLGNVIVITFYSPSCLGQETPKGPFGLRVKLPPAHLSTTHGGGFTQSL